MFPGPGAYTGALVSSIGNQFLSTRTNVCHGNSFGTGIRNPNDPLRSPKDSVPGAANVIKAAIKGGAGPGEYGAGPESIGFQTLSHRKTLPTFSFGSTGTRIRKRDRFKQDRVTVYGTDSPGPAGYDGRIPSFGHVPYSNLRRSREARFGTSGKFGGNFRKKPRDKSVMTPGPGQYVLLSSVTRTGHQVESDRPSTAQAKFGTSTRADMYASERDKMKLPGPGQYAGFIGKEELFGPKSPAFGFGTTRKFRSKRVIMKDSTIRPRTSSPRAHRTDSPRSRARRLIERVSK